MLLDFRRGTAASNDEDAPTLFTKPNASHCDGCKLPQVVGGEDSDRRRCPGKGRKRKIGPAWTAVCGLQLACH